MSFWSEACSGHATTELDQEHSACRRRVAMPAARRPGGYKGLDLFEHPGRVACLAGGGAYLSCMVAMVLYISLGPNSQ